MSAQAGFSNAGKKAVHVKWAGKTIALGTFPASEADEKCARAKALTRAWRSTMRPKPTRDWVMVELERLGVRVVSGRLGRKAGEEGEDDHLPPPPKKGGAQAQGMGGVMGGSPPVERSGSMGWGNDGDLNSLMNRRTSMGLSMMNDRRGSLGSLGQVVGLDGGDPNMAHRQLGGLYDVGDAQRRASSLGLGSLTGGGLGGMGMSVNPNQHYEMLKLHHMNLLNEIQETTLMMNLYQQQQLQQQQQQLQQQVSAEGLVSGDPQMSMMHQPNMDPMFGAGQLSQQQRASLGLGGGGNYGSPQMQMMQQHQQMMLGGGGGGPAQQQENRSPMGGKDGGEGMAAPGSDNKRSSHDGAGNPSNKQHGAGCDGDDDSDDDDDDDDDDHKEE